MIGELSKLTTKRLIIAKIAEVALVQPISRLISFYNKRVLQHSGGVRLWGLCCILFCSTYFVACDLSKRETVPKKAVASTSVRKLYAPGADKTETVSMVTIVPASSESEQAAQSAAILSGQLDPNPDPSPEAEPVARSRRIVREHPESHEPIVGPLTDSAFQSVVSNWSGMKRCLATQSSRRRTQEKGSIELSLTISGEGRVIKSQVSKTSSGLARAMASCVESRARRLRFPQSSEKKVEKTAKFVF